MTLPRKILTRPLPKTYKMCMSAPRCLAVLVLIHGYFFTFPASSCSVTGVLISFFLFCLLTASHQQLHTLHEAATPRTPRPGGTQHNTCVTHSFLSLHLFAFQPIAPVFFTVPALFSLLGQMPMIYMAGTPLFCINKSRVHSITPQKKMNPLNIPKKPLLNFSLQLHSD